MRRVGLLTSGALGNLTVTQLFRSNFLIICVGCLILQRSRKYLRMSIRHFPASTLLCAILLVVASISVCTTNTPYVRPEYNHACPGEPCHTLSYYEQRVPKYFASDTTMVFLNGTHYPENALVIRDIKNFIMIGSGGFTIGSEDLHEANSKIECAGTNVSGFNFIEVTGIHIENLTFAYCGQAEKVTFKVHAALAFNVAYNVNLSRVTVRNSCGFGLQP